MISEQMNFHILCVDDIKEIGDVLVNWFRNHTNCIIAHVMNAKDALKYLENNQVDLVITNQLMPDIDGLELTNIITKKYPTKVIVFTGYGGTHKEAFQKGASAFVQKPCKIDNLLEVVYKVMKEDAFNVVM